MVANLEIILKEMIQPSSPTPHHLRNLQLSFLDQIAPPVYIPLIFFYQANQLTSNNKEHAQISLILKQSLSNVLAQFYPLTGRLTSGISSVDCNDAGALFVEAQVHTNLSEVIDKPIMQEIKQYFPLESHGRDAMNSTNTFLLGVQTNFFSCGGIAIGVQMSHKIADGTSLVTFMNAWAANCRRDAENIAPSGFDLANIFPPLDASSFGSEPPTAITKEKIVTERFVFDKEKLAKLKQAAASAPGPNVKDPTRVEAVSAFFWRHFIKASNSKSKKIVAVSHAVNLRPRMDPALPEDTFGNLWTGTPLISMPEGEKEYHNLVCDLRNTIRRINSSYAKKLQNGDEYLRSFKKAVKLVSKEEIVSCIFSSWCRFPVYEVDYGWGKPTWVCTTTMPIKNVVILMSTSCGEGIEAWVNLVEEDLPSLRASYTHLSIMDV